MGIFAFLTGKGNQPQVDPNKPATRNYNIVRSSGSEVVLTAGSDLDKPSYPQPQFLAAGHKAFTSFRPNGFMPFTARRAPANFGSVSSTANYGFRYSEYGPGIGLYPGTVPSASRPMWNNLVPIQWHLRDLDPQAMAQTRVQVPVVQIGPSDFTPTGTASLSENLL